MRKIRTLKSLRQQRTLVLAAFCAPAIEKSRFIPSSRYTWCHHMMNLWEEHRSCTRRRKRRRSSVTGAASPKKRSPGSCGSRFAPAKRQLRRCGQTSEFIPSIRPRICPACSVPECRLLSQTQSLEEPPFPCGSLPRFPREYSRTPSLVASHTVFPLLVLSPLVMLRTEEHGDMADRRS